MGVPEAEALLTHLAIKDNVAASTQNQALSTLLFLSSTVTSLTNPYLNRYSSSPKQKRLPPGGAFALT
jgi:hypothetical protein